MKQLFVSLLALSALSAHADVTGSVSLLVNSDYSPGFSNFQVNDDGDKLVGIGGANVYLEKQNGGYKGFSFGRPFNVSCSNNVCDDNGSTQLHVEVTPVPGGYSLDGTLNYVSVHATVTDAEVSLSTTGFSSDMGFDLTSNRDGSYSGDGTFPRFLSFHCDSEY